MSLILTYLKQHLIVYNYLYSSLIVSHSAFLRNTILITVLGFKQTCFIYHLVQLHDYILSSLKFMSRAEKYNNLFVKADQALHCERINSTAHLARKENQGKGGKYLMI